ncbi:hypothetical protein DFH06DRAFT_1122822 [Mycena polygramma]|nr:hypothetical protein DFH06DRAFT_1122822 [Mycena polygramma]
MKAFPNLLVCTEQTEGLTIPPVSTLNERKKRANGTADGYQYETTVSVAMASGDALALATTRREVQMRCHRAAGSESRWSYSQKRVLRQLALREAPPFAILLGVGIGQWHEKLERFEEASVLCDA